MAVTFSEIPTSTLRLLAGVELDRTGTSPAPNRARTVIVGQKLAAGTATANAIIYVGTEARAKGLFGQGSLLHLMCKAYLANDPTAELWAIPVADAAGTKATGSIQVTAAATGDGSISLYVAGQWITVGVTAGDIVGTIATAIGAAINDALDLPVTATVSTDTVTITCRHFGVLGNEIDVRHSYRTGERLPSGVTLAITQLASGATDPTLTTANVALAAADWRWCVYPFTTDGQQDALDVIMLARWDAMAGQLGGHFSAYDDTVGNLQTWAGNRNSPHGSTAGFYASPTPAWEVGAAYAGACAKSLRKHTAVPLADLVVKGVLAPAEGVRFTSTEANTLGLDGVATLYTDATGAVKINNAVTHYKTDALGTADTTYQFLNAPYQTAKVIDTIQGGIRSQFSGKILVDDVSLVSSGTPACDTAMIRAFLLGQYGQLERDAVVENADAFAEVLVVERDTVNANRVNVYYPPDLANQLHVLAVLVRPYLQLPGAQ
jgi:phage tail sheath gpL-like